MTTLIPKYDQGATGAVNRPINLKLSETVSVKDFGAVGNGTTDDSAAITAAHATGKLVYYPSGTYLVTTNNITIPGGGMIGSGTYDSSILSNDTSSNDIFNYTGQTEGLFQNIQFQHSGIKTAGYCLTFTGSGTGEVSGIVITGCIFNSFPACINFKRAALWSITSCNFYNFTAIGINVDNQNTGDSGDSSIVGCILIGSGTGATAINQVSSGGLKIIGNKFNNGGIGYLLNLGAVVGGVGTSVLIINGNSFENHSFSNIQLQRQGGVTTTFDSVVINANEFYNASAGQAAIYSTDSSGFLSNVLISNNVIKINAAGYGMLLNYITRLLVSDNLIQGSTGAIVGISSGSSNVSSKLGINAIYGFTQSIAATTNTAIVKSDVQTGTATVTTSSADGSLYYGTTTITFATAFTTGISISVLDGFVSISNATNGAISCFVVSITNTQMVIGAIGFTSSGAVGVNWKVTGVI